MDTQQQRAFNLRASTFCSFLRIGWSRSAKRRGPRGSPCCTPCMLMRTMSLKVMLEEDP